MIYTLPIQKAIRFAVKTHEVYQKQKRKGKDIAYITHPLIVGLILASVKAPEEVVIAGILHDTIEDCPKDKKVTRAMIAERFGERVADMVASVSETGLHLTWSGKKRSARSHIAKFNEDSLLVKSADLLSNGTELVADWKRDGDKIFERFTGGKKKTLEHYIKVVEIIVSKWERNPLLKDLVNLGKDLQAILE